MQVPTFRLIRDQEDQARLAAAVSISCPTNLIQQLIVWFIAEYSLFLQLVPYTRTANFPNQAVIAHHSDVADRVIIISSGRVAMCTKTVDGTPETINDRLCVLQEGLDEFPLNSFPVI